MSIQKGKKKIAQEENFFSARRTIRKTLFTCSLIIDCNENSSAAAVELVVNDVQRLVSINIVDDDAEAIIWIFLQ